MLEVEKRVRKALSSCRAVAHCTVGSGVDGKARPLDQIETTLIVLMHFLWSEVIQMQLFWVTEGRGQGKFIAL